MHTEAEPHICQCGMGFIFFESLDIIDFWLVVIFSGEPIPGNTRPETILRQLTTKKGQVFGACLTCLNFYWSISSPFNLVKATSWWGRCWKIVKFLWAKIKFSLSSAFWLAWCVCLVCSSLVFPPTTHHTHTHTQKRERNCGTYVYFLYYHNDTLMDYSFCDLRAQMHWFLNHM